MVPPPIFIHSVFRIGGISTVFVSGLYRSSGTILSLVVIPLGCFPFFLFALVPRELVYPSAVAQFCFALFYLGLFFVVIPVFLFRMISHSRSRGDPRSLYRFSLLCHYSAWFHTPTRGGHAPAWKGCRVYCLIYTYSVCFSFSFLPAALSSSMEWYLKSLHSCIPMDGVLMIISFSKHP